MLLNIKRKSHANPKLKKPRFVKKSYENKLSMFEIGISRPKGIIKNRDYQKKMLDTFGIQMLNKAF